MPATILIDVNSVRHWVAVCRGKNPDDPKLTNDMMKKLTAAQVEPLFAPLKFIGWCRYRGGGYIYSGLAKDRSNQFVFETDDARVPTDRPQHWSLENLQTFSGKAPRATAVVDAAVDKREADLAPTKQDLVSARAALKKFKRTETEIQIIAMTKAKALKVLPRRDRSSHCRCTTTRSRRCPRRSAS